MARTYYRSDIDPFISDIVDEVVKYLDPELILMAGSFGKSSWLFSDDLLLSDFEFVFVCKKRWSINKKRKLLQSLNDRFDYDINLKGFILSNVQNKIISSYATGNPGYLSLEFFDTFSHPEILYKKEPDTILFKYDSKEIPVWEGWRLFANRIAHLVEIKASVKSDLELRYIWLKVLESVADAYLIVNQIYDKNISKRIFLFDKKTLAEDKSVSEYCKSSFESIVLALKAREIHSIKTFVFDDTVMNSDFVLEWMSYFDHKLAESRDIKFDNWKDFYQKLTQDKGFQNQYSEMNYKSNVLVSNMIRLVYNRQLLNNQFKFYNLFLSWQHVILFTIVSYYQENADLEDQSLIFTKSLMSKLIKRKDIEKLTDKELASMILSYWKSLR